MEIEIKKKFDLWLEAHRIYNDDTCLDDPIMSDVEFDNLTEELLNYNIPEINQIIKSGILRNSVIETSHTDEVMISLFKIKFLGRQSASEIHKFFQFNKTRKYFKAPKFDGAAIRVKWNLSLKIITSVQTRGGLEVINLLGNHPDILATLKYNSPTINGELVIDKKLFNEKYRDVYDYVNARNFVGGLVKSNKLDKHIHDDLSFIPCTDGTNPIGDYWEEIEPQEYYVLDEVIKKYKSDNFPYLCDGLVLAYHVEKREVKDNYPLNMLSIKIQGVQVETVVEDFEYTQKKSGKLTPMVLIKHVPLDGITATKANGYNYQNLRDKGIGIGSRIIIEKSNDIYPIIVKVLSKSTNIKMPDVGYYIDGKHLIACNLHETKKYKFVLGLKLLKIDGIGDTLAEKIGEVLNYNIIEIFNTKHKLAIHEALGGGKNWLKFLELYNTKTLNLDKVIELLQFDNVGHKTAYKLALLICRMSEDTSKIDGSVLTNVARGEGFKLINDSIALLREYGVNVKKPILINDDVITFEMSGEPIGMTKAQFAEKIKEKYPNSLHTSLTKTTSYLFTDSLSSNTSKNNKARKYNIKVMLYSDALKIDKL